MVLPSIPAARECRDCIRQAAQSPTILAPQVCPTCPARGPMSPRRPVRPGVLNHAAGVLGPAEQAARERGLANSAAQIAHPCPALAAFCLRLLANFHRATAAVNL